MGRHRSQVRPVEQPHVELTVCTLSTSLIMSLSHHAHAAVATTLMFTKQRYSASVTSDYRTVIIMSTGIVHRTEHNHQNNCRRKALNAHPYVCHILLIKTTRVAFCIRLQRPITEECRWKADGIEAGMGGSGIPHTVTLHFRT